MWSFIHQVMHDNYLKDHPAPEDMMYNVRSTDDVSGGI